MNFKILVVLTLGTFLPSCNYGLPVNNPYGFGQPRYGPPGGYYNQPNLQPPPYHPNPSQQNPQQNLQAALHKAQDVAPQVQFPGDAKGRSRLHPKNIPRFQKYFPGPPNCKCEYPENPLKFGPRVSPDSSSPGSPAPTSNAPGSSSSPSNMNSIYSSFIDDHHHDDLHDHDEPSSSPVTTIPALTPFVPMKKLPGNCPTKPNFIVKSKQFVITEQMRNCSVMSKMNAVDYCNELGLQLITFDSDKTVEEKNNIMDMARDLGLSSFWTSGFVSHPINDDDIQTLTWTSATMITTEYVERGSGFWSTTGAGGERQPDNYEYKKKKESQNRENCVVVFNNKFNDGIKFHDRPCNDQHHAICEQQSKRRDDMGFSSFLSSFN